MGRTKDLRRLWALEGQDLKSIMCLFGIKMVSKMIDGCETVVERHLLLPRDSLRFTISPYWEFQMISLRYLENGELAVKDA